MGKQNILIEYGQGSI